MSDPSQPLHLVFGAREWLDLFMHYVSLSLLSIGGAITTTPDMHRFLVEQRHWLTDAQFSASVAIAQAAPGPNVLFVALLGWNVGLNAGGILSALAGMALAMTGILVPSTTITYLLAQWGHRNRHLLGVRAFKQGMAPIVIALLIATGWILAGAGLPASTHWPLWLVSIATALVVWRTRIHLLWLLGAGALLGWLGLV
ncbi:MAG: chromate transporter [Comamonadaceae bacterium]|nr:MAG: chromate transporter [Comamonadaceae bacterium]